MRLFIFCSSLWRCWLPWNERRKRGNSQSDEESTWESNKWVSEMRWGRLKKISAWRLNPRHFIGLVLWAMKWKRRRWRWWDELLLTILDVGCICIYIHIMSVSNPNLFASCLLLLLLYEKKGHSFTCIYKILKRRRPKTPTFICFPRNKYFMNYIWMWYDFR